LNTRIEILKKYLEEEPGDSFLLYALALEFMALNENDQAFKYLQTILNCEPDYVPAYYMAGKTAESLKQTDKAIEYYLKGTEMAKKKNDHHTLNELKAALQSLQPDYEDE
jgi:tetratricopeptide (TPR) repeat protein